MAVLPDAVEIWDYVPPNPSNAAVLDDRYVIVVDGWRDEFAVFDAVNETSAAFSGCGDKSSYGDPTVGRMVVSCALDSRIGTVDLGLSLSDFEVVAQ